MHEKDKVFYKYYLDLDDKNVLFENKNTKARILFYTSFIEQKKDIDRSSALYGTKSLFEPVHADVADIYFSFGLQLIQNTAYWQWIFSPLKSLFIR